MKNGEMYTFKRTKGRGRPFVGTIIQKRGAITVMQMKNGEIVNIQTNRILNPYSFKPYNKISRAN